MADFRLISDYTPQGDQVAAVEALGKSLERGARHQTLMGVTGSGKTFTMANLIRHRGRPTLVISHNKTLAAQLFQEFRGFFPENAVEYFVSYYDYYQPEAYIPATNTYIAKESTINDEIDRMRLRATNSLLQRRDIIIVASVSCIYGIGSPVTYQSMSFPLRTGQRVTRRQLLRRLASIQYERRETDFLRNSFRVRGDVVELFPSYEERALRIRLTDTEIERLEWIDPILGNVLEAPDKVLVYPKTFFSTPRDILDEAVTGIEREMEDRVAYFKQNDQPLEAARIEERTLFDLEMLREFGWCPGIENYSRFLSRRKPGEPPFTLLDYFPDDFLIIIDESHVSVPQIGGMYHGDRSRKRNLIEHGFRLPSALDNRPLNFQEFESRSRQTLYVSATPGLYELRKSAGRVVEQIIRPTGLIDPEVKIRPVKGQVDDLRAEIEIQAERGERTLITTLTKKMAENLTRHYHELGLRVRYLHSDIDTLDRVRILRELRRGDFDALIGINLLREGLDLPEVSLVAVLDADKEGFLRSATSLIQTFGRAARNVSGRVILYADNETDAMRRAVRETARRRRIQEEYNRKNRITPRSIRKGITGVLESPSQRDYFDWTRVAENRQIYLSPEKRNLRIAELEKLMAAAVKKLEFEKAAAYRDELKELKRGGLALG